MNSLHGRLISKWHPYPKEALRRPYPKEALRHHYPKAALRHPYTKAALRHPYPKEALRHPYPKEALNVQLFKITPTVPFSVSTRSSSLFSY